MVARFPKNKKRGAWQQITVAVLLGIPVCEEVWEVLGKTDPAKDAGQANTGNFWSDLWNKIKNINP